MILGTCSLCGGRVTVPDVWHGVIPPDPTCDSCHAVKADHGPVIAMKPGAPRSQGTSSIRLPRTNTGGDQ